ncbi:hypothetical protein VFPPC_18220 [Pochonia chlamydosporia 170]|uniref:Uncharacterized protein n=1 Tax=Pochonia chlamydosporia 170 TaxID=1380566 RepID=A0A219AP46_METCM|nr:hypothetical protein VFPPC_18220 [Pochonia chlamydosporia 170]OWT42608.1 hypothetical protein VFPPC_18220 [Pochonia chlamydosporia 170]
MVIGFNGTMIADPSYIRGAVSTSSDCSERKNHSVRHISRIPRCQSEGLGRSRHHIRGLIIGSSPMSCRAGGVRLLRSRILYVCLAQATQWNQDIGPYFRESPLAGQSKDHLLRK